jgi:hypothetical protein
MLVLTVDVSSAIAGTVLCNQHHQSSASLVRDHLLFGQCNNKLIRYVILGHRTRQDKIFNGLGYLMSSIYLEVAEFG